MKSWSSSRTQNPSSSSVKLKNTTTSALVIPKGWYKKKSNNLCKNSLKNIKHKTDRGVISSKQILSQEG